MLSYYRDSKIVDYLFASHNGGNSSIPLFAGAVFENNKIGVADIHLIRFRYVKEYKNAIAKDYLTGGVSAKDRKGSFKDILQVK
jgi:hypothetical protein